MKIRLPMWAVLGIGVAVAQMELAKSGSSPYGEGSEPAAAADSSADVRGIVGTSASLSELDGTGEGQGTLAAGAAAERALEGLSPAHRTIARALFEAQAREPSLSSLPRAHPALSRVEDDRTGRDREDDTGCPSVGVGADAGDGPAAADTNRAWTLERIIAARRDGRAWVDVFEEMKAHGVIEQRSLGRVVRQFNRRREVAAAFAGAASAGSGCAWPPQEGGPGASERTLADLLARLVIGRVAQEMNLATAPMRPRQRPDD
jgi:hypothetical protein